MKRSARVAAIATGLLTLVGIALPAAAQAAAVSVQSTQVLPPGGASCAALTVVGVTPYVADGQLESFDVTIADPSYVALQAQVGDTVVPFNYMSRWYNSDGTVKIHVDVPATAINGSTNVSLTLLASPAGQPTCLSSVTFPVLGSAASGSRSGTASGTGTPTKSSSTGSSSHSTAGTGTKAGGGVKAPTSSASSSSSTISVVSPVISAGMQRNLERACEASGAFQLWFVLLALFAVIVVLTAIAQPPLVDRTPALPLAIILIPLALLIGFWYLAALCRAASWVPITLVVAAILGLLAAFRDRQAVANVIQLPPAQPKK